MACTSCGARTYAPSYTPPVPVTCTETKQSYEDLLVKVDTQLITNPNYLIYRQTVKSQILNYDKGCGLFQKYILDNIVPLIV